MSQYSDFEEEEFKTQITSKTMLRLLGLVKPHWKTVAGFLTGIIFVSIIDAYFTFLSKQIIDNGILAKNNANATSYFIIYAILVIVQGAAVLGFIYMVGILGERIRYDLRQTMFDHLQDLSLSYFSRTPVGWIIARVTSDSDRVADLMTWGIQDIVWAITNIITGAYFMIIINSHMAVIVFTTLPILLIVAIQFRTRILLQYRKVRRFNSRITGAINENITGVRVVKALCREDENLHEFSELTNQMYKASFRAAWLSALFLPSVQIISAIALSFIIWFGGKQVQVATMTIGGIQAFISYVFMMIWPIQDVARIYAEMQHAIASSERIFSLVDATPEVKNLPGAMDPGSIKGDIRFDHVEFFYEADKPVLQDFSLSIKQGELVALVGPTGGGKSTIVNLLCRFYEPKNGTISIGGHNYMDLDIYAIQSRIGIVLQTPHLFSGTIKENIRYGKLDASDDEIIRASKIAYAHDFITTLEKGYDQEVGEGGNLLSVGQKQLISLARAVLANPEIFIMDEATSSVDTLTEALIQRGMENLMKGRTSFIIAHRLSTIKRADKIVVIDNGQISEMGDHSELLRRQGHYFHLYTQQFRHKLESEYEDLSSVSAMQV